MTIKESDIDAIYYYKILMGTLKPRNESVSVATIKRTKSTYGIQ